MSNGYLTGCALIISVLITFIFFVKKTAKNIETKIFKKMLIINILESLTTTLIVVTALTTNSNSIFVLLNRMDVILICTWASLMLYYIYSISIKTVQKNKNRFLKSILIINLIIYILANFLDVTIINKNGVLNSTGPLTLLGLIGASIYIVLMVVILIKSFLNTKSYNIGEHKYIPLYLLILLLIVVTIFRVYVPEINLVSIVLSLVDMIMMFTIENPDVKMLEEVTIAKETAERANRAKTDFLSSMSHEIRTPLNAIVGFSECILESHDLKKVKSDAKDIIMASQNLLEIVNGILDISKIEADKMEINSSEYSLVDNMNNIAKLMIPRIGEKPILLKTKFAKDIPDVLYGDIGKIKQIVTNLLTNAVKYTDKGIINFEINCLNKGSVCTLVISVEDTGRGIKPEKIDSIFNKFERLEEDRNTTLEGTGLGLAITKRMAQMMGGKVVVQSKYGSGSKFTVYLKQRIVNKPAIIKEEEFNSNEKFDCSGKRVLIVDDNNINLKVAVRLLEPYKMYITTCQSGQECIDMANSELFDLILLDDMMPGLTGKETLVKLQENPNFNVPVVALTANAIEGMKEEYLKLGFNDYLAKPIDKLELERVLRKNLGDSKDVMKNTFEPLPNELFDMNVPLK